MADETTAFVIPLHQIPPAKKARTRSGSAKTPRPRTRKKAKTLSSETALASEKAAVPANANFEDADSFASEAFIPPEFLPTFSMADEPPVTRTVAATSSAAKPATPARWRVTSLLLSIAALALAAVGLTINGWFARSLGSSDVAGWMFLAVGVAADLVALVMPSCAAALWHAGQRATALVGWTVWLMTFVFAVTAGIGFASTNITDVTSARAARITPAVATAQAALGDAMAARDRECKSGVGKFCREREAVVTERRQILDTAMTSVGHTADPQTDAAVKLAAWVSGGLLRPTADDFAMLRLILLALLPQIGGILLLVGRSRA
jgi:hypothetical protein